MSPNAGGGEELRGLSQWVQLYTEAQINFGDLTPYLIYGSIEDGGPNKWQKNAHHLISVRVASTLHYRYT
jgi:hypothetical protein